MPSREVTCFSESKILPTPPGAPNHFLLNDHQLFCSVPCLSLMSFIHTIDFCRRPPDSSQSRRSASPQRRSTPSGGRGAYSPEPPSRTSSPDDTAGTSARHSSQQLEEYAVTCARRNRLSTTSEEGLVEFTHVRSCLSSCILRLHDNEQLSQEEKLINLWSKVARIGQQMDLEASAAGSGANFDLPLVPKNIMVGTFIEA